MDRLKTLPALLLAVGFLLCFAIPARSEAPQFTPILFSQLTSFRDSGDEERKGEFEIKHVLRAYWQDGIHLDSPEGRLKMKAGGELQLDGGFFHLDDAMQEKFGDETSNGKVRRARLYLTGAFGKRISFKTEWDLTGSDGAVIKDNYLAITNVPVVRRIQFGYMQEPFSLNQITSNTATAFMERSLADTLAPRHNVGFLLSAAPHNKLFTMTGGFFYDSDNFGNPKGNANALTGRFTYLPIYKNDGDDLLHFGFNYSFRNQTNNTVRFRQQPESFLLPNFVDTKTFSADFLNVYGLEAAYQTNHVAFESEFILSATHNSDPTVPDPVFSGYYIEAIYSPGAGKQRVYDRDRGIFVLRMPSQWPNLARIDRDRWLITSRISHIDLNDKNVQGGVMTDFTAGLNFLMSKRTILEWNYILSHRFSVGHANIFQARFQIYL